MMPVSLNNYRAICYGNALKICSSCARLIHACAVRPNVNEHSNVRRVPALDHDDHPFYNYISGRWLYNESRRLSERRHRFNVEALCRKVAQCVNRSPDDIVRFAKIAEGGSYRVFEITFNDDVAAIARLPYPVTLPRKSGIASEVATMQYLKLHNLPIPKILDWNVDELNSVGSEYMIMEKVPGKELESIWYTMTYEERKQMMTKIVDIEEKLFDIKFPANGSLYPKGFLDPSVDTVDILAGDTLVESSSFCIGPSTEYLWWYNERHKLGVNGGPWHSTGEVLEAPAYRELNWLQKFGQARFPREPLYREFYNYKMVDPQAQIDNLTDYLEIAQQIRPKDTGLDLPTLRHPDFSPHNMFVSESGDITGIIDWQHSVILPLFLQAKIPKHFQNYGDDDSENFRRPTLPENFESLSDSDREREEELHRRRQVHYFYLGFTSRNNEPHFRAMARHDLILRNQIYEAASRPWEGDGVSLKAALIRLASQWPSIVGSSGATFPLQFSEAEVGECMAIDDKQKVADEQMESMRNHLGINIDGWVPNHRYEEAKEKEGLMKEETLALATNEQERKEIDENWPFQGYDEVD